MSLRKLGVGVIGIAASLGLIHTGIGILPGLIIAVLTIIVETILMNLEGNEARKECQRK